MHSILKNVGKEKALAVLRFNKITAFPVNPIEIAKSYGFSVKSLEENLKMKDVKGVTLYDERSNKYVILYDKSNEDKHFTIAHELGHIFLGHFKDGLLVKMGSTNGSKYERFENEADKFAFSLINGI